MIKNIFNPNLYARINLFIFFKLLLFNILTLLYLLRTLSLNHQSIPIFRDILS